MYKIKLLTLLVWVMSLSTIITYSQAQETVYVISVAPAYDLVAFGNSQREVVVKNLSTDLTLHIFDEPQYISDMSLHDFRISDIVFSPDASQIAILLGSTMSGGGVVRIIETDTGISVLDFPVSPFVGEIDWKLTSQGERIIFSTATGSGSVGAYFVNMLDGSTFDLLYRKEVPFIARDGLQFNSVGTRIAYIQGEEAVISDLDLNELFRLTGHTQTISDLEWSPDGQYIATVEASSLKVWDSQTGIQAHNFMIQINDTFSFPTEVTWNPLSNQIAILGDSGIYIWDIVSNSIVNQISTSYNVYDAYWLSDDEIIYTANDDIMIETLDSCSTSSIPAGSVAELINAINSANANPDATSICLANGMYTFTAANNSTNALPVISSDVTILGNGATLVRSSSSNFRFFTVNSGGHLTLENITLTGGSVGSQYGGALHINGGQLTLNNATIHPNLCR